jgi:Flp pilus assembly protein TadG
MRAKMRQYVANREGASAIEFAILFLPFIMLVFAILELAIVFFITATMTHATHEVAREIRTGQFQMDSCSNGAAEFKSKICDKMYGLGKCTQRLRIDVITDSNNNFADADLTPIPTEEDPANPGQPQMPADVFQTTGPQDVVVVRANYYHHLAAPATITRLANMPGNTRLLTATTAFLNEPYPDPC